MSYDFALKKRDKQLVVSTEFRSGLVIVAMNWGQANVRISASYRSASNDWTLRSPSYFQCSGHTKRVTYNAMIMVIFGISNVSFHHPCSVYNHELTYLKQSRFADHRPSKLEMHRAISQLRSQSSSLRLVAGWLR